MKSDLCPKRSAFLDFLADDGYESSILLLQQLQGSRWMGCSSEAPQSVHSAAPKWWHKAWNKQEPPLQLPLTNRIVQVAKNELISRCIRRWQPQSTSRRPAQSYVLRMPRFMHISLRPKEKFEGPWFTTQLMISASIGITSFLLFSYCRARWPLSFAPRTKLKGTQCTKSISDPFINFLVEQAFPLTKRIPIKRFLAG